MFKIKENGKKDAAGKLVSLYHERSATDSKIWMKSYIACHENRPEKDAIHEAIILEMNVIYDDETRVQEERGRDDALNGRIN